MRSNNEARSKRRLNVVVSAETHKRLKLMAAEYNTTITNIVTDAIEAKIDSMERYTNERTKN